MKNRFDRIAFIRTLILGAFTLYFYSLVSTEKVLLYVHPRMVLFVQGAIILFAGMTLFQAKELFTKKAHRYPSSKFGYLFVVIPLVLAFSGPASGLSAQIAGQKPFRLGVGESGISMDALINKEAIVDLSSEFEKGTGPERVDRVIPNSNTGIALVFTKDNFIDNLAVIHEDIERYMGVSIEIEGFIYRNELFAQEEFVVARYLMSCCAADTQVVGLFCSYPEINKYPLDAWIQIRGVLDVAVFQQERIPILRVESIQEISAPENPYLYR